MSVECGIQLQNLYLITVQGGDEYRGIILKKWEDTDSGICQWHLTGPSYQSFVKVSPDALGIGITVYKTYCVRAYSS